MRKLFLLSFLSSFCCLSFAQHNVKFMAYPESGNVNKVYISAAKVGQREIITLPASNGLKILKGDLHIHTMFSDGNVWPSYRVSEAWEDGLDFLSITDHIEYRPHTKYLNSDDLNISYEIAKNTATSMGMILIPGIEITRDQYKVGHFNALFIKDANAIKVDDPKEAIKAAKKQNAFVLFNHPAWLLDSCKLNDFQRNVLDEKLIDGIEVVNHHEFYPRVLSWSKDYNLTAFANSDTHGIISEEYKLSENNPNAKKYRVMTLLFVNENEWNEKKDNEKEALDVIRKAMDDHMTLVYFDGKICGREDLLKNFLEASLEIKKMAYSNKDNAKYVLTNKSSVPMHLLINSNNYFLNPMSEFQVTFKNKDIPAAIKVLNMQHYEFTPVEIPFK